MMETKQKPRYLQKNRFRYAAQSFLQQRSAVLHPSPCHSQHCFGINLTRSGKWYLGDFNPAPTASPELCRCILLLRHSSPAWAVPGMPSFLRSLLPAAGEKGENTTGFLQIRFTWARQPPSSGLLRRCIPCVLGAAQKYALRRSCQALTWLWGGSFCSQRAGSPELQSPKQSSLQQIT